MATECRRTKRVNKQRLVRLLTVIAVLIATAFTIGRLTAPTKTDTVTVTKTVEVPVYSTDKLPETSDIFYFDVPLSHSLQRYIYEICADENVPVTLVYAMIEHESQFNPEIVSKTDDYGLMQINEVNHTWLNEEYRCADMLDPYQNVFCGVKIIGEYVNRYDGDLTKALMAYNMGDYGARKAWENGVKEITYSNTILGLMQNYEEVLQNARVIELLDKKVETLFNRQDFEYLLERYMGHEAVQYFRDMIEEIEDSYNGQIDELTVQNENLREKLEDIREVCRE